MSAVIEDKQAWSRAKQTFRALSAPGMEWEDLTEDQRLYWRNRATDVCGPEPVEMTLWQCTITEHGAIRPVTFYLDAGVQGLPDVESAIAYLGRHFNVLAASVMAIRYDVVPS